MTQSFKGFIKEYARKNWGEIFFHLCSGLTLLQLLLKPGTQRGHYRVFVGAGDYLLKGLNPYGVAFEGTTSGNFLYSISNGWFFGLISLLPETLGIAAFIAFSWFVIAVGVRRCLYLFMPDYPSAITNWTWVFIAFEMMGGILSNKLEILIAGLMLIAVSWVAERRNLILAGAAFGMLIDWKLQPAPTAAFLVIVLWSFFRDWRFFVGLVLSYVTLQTLPSLVYSPELISEMAKIRSATLLVQLKDFVYFDHVYRFWMELTHTTMSFEQVTLASTVAAGALGTAFVGLNYFGGERSPIRFRLHLALALLMGSLYTLSFSPLSQNSAYIMVAPLWIAVAVLVSQAPQSLRKVEIFSAFIGWVWISLSFSDLFPRAFKDWARLVGWKSVGVLVLSLAFVYFWLLTSRNSKHAEHRLEPKS